VIIASWLACADPRPDGDPWAAQRAVAAAQRPLLRAAEGELVLASLQAARRAGDDAAEARALALAVDGGWLEQPVAGHSARPLDGREVGVTLAHGRAVLDGFRAELWREVDEVAWATATAAALGVAAGASPEGAISAAIDAGRAESEVVVVGVEAAIAAVDPAGRVVWPAEVAAWEQHHAGFSVGVGLEVYAPAPGVVAVASVDPLGPAWAAGVHVDDTIAAIDGAPPGSVEEAEVALAGPEGTTAAVTVGRGDETLNLDLVRAAVPEVSVRGERRRDDQGFDPRWFDDVAWVHITGFRPDTDEELAAMVGSGPWSSVVLDLRGNGGGDVQAALNVVDAWLDEGILAGMSGRRAPLPEAPTDGAAAWNEAVPGGPFVGAKTLVLVDQETASAAEIVAGALQELAGATVIGAPTFGKGSSQGLRADPSGVAWQVTNMVWTLPSGRPLTPGQGIAPDLLSPPTAAERWQVARLTARREAPTRHEDGSVARWVGPDVSASLPTLIDDLVRLEAAAVVGR
jgi:carboxyl-terminal processing protease